MYLAEAEKRGLLSAFYLELTTGLRRGELLASNGRTLDVENRTLAVTKQVNRINGELSGQSAENTQLRANAGPPQQAVDLLIAEHKSTLTIRICFHRPRPEPCMTRTPSGEQRRSE